jgi:hypothetical protein
MQLLIRKLTRQSRRLSGKRDQDVDQRSCCLHYSAQPNSAAATVIFFNIWGWEVFTCPPCSLHLLSQTSICSQRWKSTFEVSTSTLGNMFKMKSRTGYVARILFVYERLDKLICYDDTCLHTLLDCVEK